MANVQTTQENEQSKSAKPSYLSAARMFIISRFLKLSVNAVCVWEVTLTLAHLFFFYKSI